MYGSGTSASFPYDDNAIRFAYDEWRLIYGKGDFNSARFDNFKTNYKTLTMANIQAREKATQQGQPVPQWMSLNEYGDCSVEEYEAIVQGRQQQNRETITGTSTTTTAANKNNGYVNAETSYNYNYGSVVGNGEEDQYGRPIRSTEVIQQSRGTQVIPVSSRGTQVIQSSSSYGLEQQAMRQPTYDPSMSFSGSGGEEYQDQFGRTIRPTQVLKQQSPVFQPGGPRGTQVISSAVTLPGGTQVVQSDGVSPYGRGTQVIKSDDNINGRGTQVIQSSIGDGNSPFSRGTQVIQPNDGATFNSSFGTQVIRSENPNVPSALSGTQVVRSENSSLSYSSSSYGTQVIKSADGISGGTQVVNQENTKSDYSPSSSFGTQVIKVGDREPSISDPRSDRGTVVISKENREIWSEKFDELPSLSSGDEGNENENEDYQVGRRGTRVIRRQIPEPDPSFNPFSFFGSGSEGKRETVVIDKKPTKEEEAQSKSSNGFFGFLGSSRPSEEKEKQTDPPSKGSQEAEDSSNKPSIFSFFSGQQKSENSTSVRGTITLQPTENHAKKSTDKRRKTVLIPKKPVDDYGFPSILSFFGGAKKVSEEQASRNPNARPTLLIKKPKKKVTRWFSFSTGNNDQVDPAQTNEKSSTSSFKVSDRR
jgi:hypothetical protein